MRSRTLGWIQDAGELNKLRKVVEVFKLSDRPLDIVESQKLVGISLDIGRWADNTYVRLAEALGFIEYNRETDDFSLTELGIDLLNSEPNSMAERTIFEKGLLSYPPACRILELLVNYGHLTKFDIAKNLGFSGERGFTLYGKENFIKEYHLAPNKSAKNKIISYKEGTADKYARMIAHYLIQMGWVESVEMDLKYEEAGAVYSARTPHAYRITDQGRKAYRRALGASIQNKVTKNVSFEMLASGKMAGYKY
ncbi:MAG: restriction endonuclease FokI catalytic domain-containing protein [candidate division WOR-3 bacterium]